MVSRGKVLRGLFSGQGWAFDLRRVNDSGSEQSHPLMPPWRPPPSSRKSANPWSAAPAETAGSNKRPGAIQPHQTNSAPGVEWDASATMRAEILTPIVGTYFVSDPEPSLGIVGDGWIRLVERRCSNGDLRAPLPLISGRARIDVVTTVAVGVPRDGYASGGIRARSPDSIHWRESWKPDRARRICRHSGWTRK